MMVMMPDHVECTTSVVIDYSTTAARRQQVQNPCQNVTYYFLLVGSASETNYTIGLHYGASRICGLVHCLPIADEGELGRRRADPGCDGCGGYLDSCGCHPVGTLSDCGCQEANYRGYDSVGLDRSLLVRPSIDGDNDQSQMMRLMRRRDQLSELQLLRQYVAQTQVLSQQIQTLFATTQDTATTTAFNNIIDETFYYQSLLDGFNPYMESVRAQLTPSS